MLKTLQEGGAYNRELVMSGARHREIVRGRVCVCVCVCVCVLRGVYCRSNRNKSESDQAEILAWRWECLCQQK